jgi:hypothetical protein
MSDGSAAAVRAFAGTCVSVAVDRARSASALEGGDDRTQLLRDSLSASSRRAAALALRAAGVLGERRAMAIALDSLSTTDPSQRANAIEVIERVGASEVVRPLLAMWDAADAGSVGRADVLERLRYADDEWIRACVKLIDDATNEGGPVTRTLDTLSTMERVLFLRKVPLFAALPPEDLQPIAAIATEHAFSGGDVFANQGEPGDVMHIIVSGDVSVVDTADDGRVVAVRSPGDVVGEMAVITSEPRIATLVASSDVRVLSIDRRRFEAILRERPETSLGVIRVLCHRLTELQTPTARPGGDGGALPPAAVSPG